MVFRVVSLMLFGFAFTVMLVDNLSEQESTNFEKICSHHKNLGTRSVTWTKFHSILTTNKF
jgi:hypothetical protein